MIAHHKRIHLHGGGNFEAHHFANGITITWDLSDTTSRLIRYSIDEAVRCFFDESDIKTFRPARRVEPVSPFMPRCSERGAMFSDGSQIVVRDGEAFPVAPYPGMPGYVRGKGREEYKAFRFYAKVNDEARVFAAIRRWAQKAV